MPERKDQLGRGDTRRFLHHLITSLPTTVRSGALRELLDNIPTPVYHGAEMLWRAEILPSPHAIGTFLNIDTVRICISLFGRRVRAYNDSV